MEFGGLSRSSYRWDRGKKFFANNAKDADAAFSVIVKNKVPALNSPEFKKEYISVEKGKNNTLNFSVRFY